MTEKTEVRTTKRPYRKPQLVQVQLALEEAVLAGCKANAIAPGPFGGGSGCLSANAQCFYLQT